MLKLTREKTLRVALFLWKCDRAKPAMKYLRFVQAHALWLLFGALLTFTSSFGQTFFVGIFSASFRDAFAINHGTYGALYSAATLVSAALIIRLGRLIDSVSLPLYTAAVGIALVLACIGLASAVGPASLFVAFV